MKILQICSHLSERGTGAEKFCLELSTRLSQQRNAQVAIASDFEAGINKKFLNIKFFKLSQERNKIKRKIFLDYFNKKNLDKIKLILAEFKPDIIHFHNVYGIGSNLIRYCSQKNKTVATVHDCWPFNYDGTIIDSSYVITNNFYKFPLAWLHLLINRLNYKEAILVSPSKWLKEYLVNIGKFKKVINIPNGIRLGNTLTKYNKEILWVGRLSNEKGIAEICPLLEEIQNITDWQVNIIGDGPLGAYLRNKYPKLNFVGFTKPEEYYKRASIQIVSSVCFENFPYTVIEGMSYGLCVVGNDTGGIKELIKDNVNGLKYKHPAELKGILLPLINNPERIRAIGAKAREFVQQFSWSNCLDQYIELYNYILRSDV